MAKRPVRSATTWLDRTKPDIVSVHHPFPLSAAVIHAGRARRIPTVATNHTIPACSLWGIRHTGVLYALAASSFGRWIRLLLDHCDEVATPTVTAAAALRSLGYRKTVHTISNGIDTERFSPGREELLRGRLGIDDRPVVLYTGRLDGEKQMDVWLRAASIACERIDAQFVVGGQGTDRIHLERLAREFGLGGRVHFIGYLEDAELPALYRMAAIYFITSPVELQSICTLEAVASGLPVVAVAAGALPELVIDGVNGNLVAPGDWRAAGMALAMLIRDQTVCIRMGAESRKVALEHDLQRTVESYEQLFQRAAVRMPGNMTLEQASTPR